MKSHGIFLELSMWFADGSAFFDLVMLDFTHILQGYSSSEVILNDMNK